MNQVAERGKDEGTNVLEKSPSLEWMTLFVESAFTFSPYTLLIK